MNIIYKPSTLSPDSSSSSSSVSAFRRALRDGPVNVSDCKNPSYVQMDGWPEPEVIDLGSPPTSGSRVAYEDVVSEAAGGVSSTWLDQVRKSVLPAQDALKAGALAYVAGMTVYGTLVAVPHLQALYHGTDMGAHLAPVAGVLGSALLGVVVGTHVAWRSLTKGPHSVAPQVVFSNESNLICS
jgi:hypothetical protein